MRCTRALCRTSSALWWELGDLQEWQQGVRTQEHCKWGWREHPTASQESLETSQGAKTSPCLSLMVGRGRQGVLKRGKI